MNDLSEYLSQQQRIEELEKRVRLLIKNNSKWKRKYEKLRGKPTPKQSRSAEARKLVIKWQDGDKSVSLADIARKYYLAYGTVKSMAVAYRKSKNQDQSSTDK